MFVGVITVLLTSLIVPLLLGALPMWVLLHPGCNQTPDPSAYGFSNFQTVQIPAQEGGSWRGYYLAGSGERADMLILVPAAYNGDAGGSLHEVQTLAQAGYSALTIESVVCARGGVHTLGPYEAVQVEDALRYLPTNTDGIPTSFSKIGLHGFSSAGASSIFAAARDLRIAAVLAEGNYSDLDAYLSVGGSGNVLEALMVFAARSAYRLISGLDTDALTPVRAISQIPPRPIFLIYGELEAIRGGAQKLVAAAKAADPSAKVELWIVPGVEHGGYIYAQGGLEEYRQRVVSFFDCALLEKCS
ncbi:MAG: hypothetical protein U0528_02880 [Anaerolineae bacterium]